MKRYAGRCAWLLSIALAVQVHAAGTIANAVDTLKRGWNLTIAGEQICATHPLPLFYARRDNQPAWTAEDAKALVGAIRRAPDDGLDPADYHLAAIESSAGDDADVLQTDAFFLLASHLQSGRIDPVTIEPTWCLEPRTSDLVPALETALENHDVEEALARFRPAHLAYHALADALATFRAMRPWQPIEEGRALKPGATGPRVDQLVARLAASGDLDPAHAAFDVRVEDAVRRVQHLYGLEEDGVVGPRTLRELNVPLDRRIRQIELNLERWRWLPATLGARHIVINIPQFQLTVYEDDRAVLTMRMIVGKDYTHRTPVFSAAINEIVFSPYWNVPDSIAGRELWPKQNSDSSYFAREHIEVLPGGRLRQKPGPWNALGLIKFNLPNRYTVYLHDTPSRELFSRAVRTFSHGCMRIEKPVDLAVHLMRDMPGWTRDRIVAESERGAERAIRLRTPVMVHVLYWTAFVNGTDDLHFAPDVYWRDDALDAAMRRKPERF